MGIRWYNKRGCLQGKAAAQPRNLKLTDHLTQKQGTAERMIKDRAAENQQAAEASQSKAAREAFLDRHQDHILRLAAKITHSSLTKSDDEWTVAMFAVSQALDSWDASRGDFWPYAAVVVQSRLTDLHRKNARSASEISVRPEAFDGDVDDMDPDLGTQMEVREHAGVTVDTQLRDEIFALQEELSPYGISFFDLAECSPKAEKTRKSCAELIRAMFAPPPPLTGEMKKSRHLPFAGLIQRTGLPKKILERHRKYLVAGTLILDGDYPGLAEYMKYAAVRQNDAGQQKIK